MAKSAPRPYPRRTLEQALRVPQALRDHNGGQPWDSAEVAKALNLGAKSGNFWYLSAASKQYGLTEGTRETAEISLTDLGRSAVYPQSSQEQAAALRNAFLSVDLFKAVLEHYGGTNLPEPQYRENTLFTKFGLDPSIQDEFVDLLLKNARFVGIGDRMEGFPDQIRTQPDDAGQAATRTLGTPTGPDGADVSAPVCFVIMPFVERSDVYPAGFFSEVLESLITPAVTDAGLQVRTAQRQGSDLIQSTIIRELLAADLVLADLTEHNPNVLFELGMRMAEDKPVVLVRAKGTGRIFDVDNLLRVEEYSPNLWPSTLSRDLPKLAEHVAAAWASRDTDATYRRLLMGEAG
jgi:hypothetical protein